MSNEVEDKSYIIFGQTNLWKSPNASNELGYYINKLMSHYKYDSCEKAGIILDGKPEQDTNYIERLKNIGIKINDNDKVVSRPPKHLQETFRASYKKDQAKLSKIKEGESDPDFFSAIKICKKRRIGPNREESNRPLFYKKDISILARNGFDFETSKKVMDLEKSEFLKIINLL